MLCPCYSPSHNDVYGIIPNEVYLSEWDIVLRMPWKNSTRALVILGINCCSENVKKTMITTFLQLTNTNTHTHTKTHTYMFQ